MFGIGYPIHSWMGRLDDEEFQHLLATVGDVHRGPDGDVDDLMGIAMGFLLVEASAQCSSNHHQIDVGIAVVLGKCFSLLPDDVIDHSHIIIDELLDDFFFPDGVFIKLLYHEYPFSCGIIK